MEPEQRTRRALVTGANSGLGLEIAAGLAAQGATVLLGCRNLAKAETARKAILSRHPAARLEILPLDLGDLASVSEAARTVREGGPLDWLVNNAGVMALDHTATADGFEGQFGVNHLGHFALTLDLLGPLTAAGSARIVTHTSIGHRPGRVDLADPHFESRPYRRWPAYFQSKLANLLFALELDRRLRRARVPVSSLAAHPGFAHTDLGTGGTSLTSRLAHSFMWVGQPAAAGARPALAAALDPRARSGQLYGPRWLLAGPPVLERPSRRARNLTVAAGLWELSERATGRRLADLL